MCKAGNQSLFKECRERALKDYGRSHLSNKDLKAIIRANGGCMSKVAKEKEVVLA